jgi:type I restriction enzyme R subunit
LFYRYISENLTNFINEEEHRAGHPDFNKTVNVSTDVEEAWHKFVTEQKEADLSAIIEDENLEPDVTRQFVNNSFRDGVLKTTGMDIDRILPPVSRFAGGKRAAKKQIVAEKIVVFFEKYLGLV